MSTYKATGCHQGVTYDINVDNLNAHHEALKFITPETTPETTPEPEPVPTLCQDCTGKGFSTASALVYIASGREPS